MNVRTHIKPLHLTGIEIEPAEPCTTSRDTILDSQKQTAGRWRVNSRQFRQITFEAGYKTRIVTHKHSVFPQKFANSGNIRRLKRANHSRPDESDQQHHIGRDVDPIRNSSTDRAALRPSAIAHTTSD